MAAEDNVYDFGKETFGYAILKGIRGNGTINIYYGESRKKPRTKTTAKHSTNLKYAMA